MTPPKKIYQYLKEGIPCSHPGCLSHITHPCEGCGRIAGSTVLPKKIYIWKDKHDGSQTLQLSKSGSGMYQNVEYLRADTITPPEVVDELEQALKFALDELSDMTTKRFSHGGDKAIRIRLQKAIELLDNESPN